MATIIVTNGFLDSFMNNENVKNLFSKTFTTKTSYWLARVLEELDKKSKIYFSEKQKLIEKYAKRYNESGEIVKDGNSIVLDNPEAFSKEISELTEIKVDLGIPKIEFDFEKEPNCNISEMSLLLPFIIPKEG